MPRHCLRGWANMEGAIITLLGIALAASIISTIILGVTLVRLAIIKSDMRKLQKRMLDEGIDTTDVRL